MAYAATTTTTRRMVSGSPFREYDTAEAEGSSAAEYTIRVPVVGTIVSVEWELSSGTSTTMRPTIRTATGGWDGSGAGANADDTSAPFTGRRLLGTASDVSGSIEFDYLFSGPLPEKTDIWASAVGPSGGAGVDIRYNIVLVDD